MSDKENGDAIPGALVHARLERGDWTSPAGRTTTDDRGGYRLPLAGLEQLSASERALTWIHVLVEAPGFVPEEDWAIRTTEGMRDRIEVDVSLPTGPVVFGRVVDPAGRAVADAEVELVWLRADGGTAPGWTMSDPSGRFSSKVPSAANAVRVQARHAEHGRSDTVDAGLRGSVDVGRLVLAPGRELAVRVTDPHGRACEGRWVHAQPCDELGEELDSDFENAAVSGPDGTARLRDLDDRRYVLETDLGGVRRVVERGERFVTLICDVPAVRVTVLDGKGRRVRNAEVSADPTTREPGGHRTVLRSYAHDAHESGAADGATLLAFRRPGVYALCARVDLGEVAWMATTLVDVDPGETPVTLQLEPAPLAACLVLNVARPPTETWPGRLEDPVTGRVVADALTSVNHGLPAGRWRLVVEPPAASALLPIESDVWLRPGETTSVDVRPGRQGGRLQVRLRPEGARGRLSARIVARGEQLGELVPFGQTTRCGTLETTSIVPDEVMLSNRIELPDGY